MITGEFKFDLEDAIRGTLPQYTAAYSVTNEPLGPEILLHKPQDKSVLTIAASGDQPITYASSGASKIDTFDITLTSKVIMDIKTAAIRTIGLRAYRHLVQNLYDLGAATKSHPEFTDILYRMPDDTRILAQEYITRRPDAFRREWGGPCFYPATDEQYEHTQRFLARNHFGFIWSDVTNLHRYLKTKYDIINLSNVFEHCYRLQKKNPDTIGDTLCNLWPYVHDGGAIICVVANSGLPDKMEYERIINTARKITPRDHILEQDTYPWATLIAITKVR